MGNGGKREGGRGGKVEKRRKEERRRKKGKKKKKRNKKQEKREKEKSVEEIVVWIVLLSLPTVMGTGVLLWVLTGTHPCDDPPKQKWRAIRAPARVLRSWECLVVVV